MRGCLNNSESDAWPEGWAVYVQEVIPVSKRSPYSLVDVNKIVPEQLFPTASEGGQACNDSLKPEAAPMRWACRLGSLALAVGE